ncbi:hypothetical protein [Levilactobacillus brevis]|uniref:hypothetical protein n=1 Tax=Levilactobacillus brevis TaxID=1580 RepID=UPI000A3006CA|nr:hypothetical protein [Levilactobacillus brevis]ARQ94418.1 hypothetical protein A6F60_11790 [Levilactobacillus brevis]
MKNKIVLSTTLSLLLALGIQTSTVHADTTSTTSTSVVPGSLKINSVPSMTFNSTVDDIANSTSTTAKLQSNGSISTTDDEGYGTATKWILAATPTELSYTGGNGKTSNLKVSTLTIAGTPITTIDGKTSTPIVNGTNEGNASTDLTADNTSITLPQDKQVFGEVYTGAITWTLSGDTGTIGGTAQ